MAIDLTKPAVTYIPALVFTWGGTGSPKRYVRSQEDLDLGMTPDTYTAMPEMEVRISPQSGGVKDNPATIVVPIDAVPIKDMITQPHAEVAVTIQETTLEDLTQVRDVWCGYIARTTARFGGQVDLCECELRGVKSRMDGVSLGIKCTDRCPWIFGKGFCQANVAGLTVVATPDSISGVVMTFTNLTSGNDAGGGNGHYTRGYVEREGLRLMIRKHTTGSPTSTLTLADAPPAEWSTPTLQPVSVAPGCDRTKPDCVHFGQQANFGAIGLLMPAHNPVLEDPGG